MWMWMGVVDEEGAARSTAYLGLRGGGGGGGDGRNRKEGEEVEEVEAMLGQVRSTQLYDKRSNASSTNGRIPASMKCTCVG